MKLFELLKNGKSTVSSALGKELAQKVLDGDLGILAEAIELSVYKVDDKNEKNIRCGASKAVELVAEQRPDLVAPSLAKLLPALEADEPQTRWVIIRTMGYCAALNRAIASQAVAYAERYLAHKEGLCIAASADLFFGDYGALSKDTALAVLPVLERSIDNAVVNEQDWLLEAFVKIAPHLPKESLGKIREFAERWQNSSRKTTQARVKKLSKLL